MKITARYEKESEIEENVRKKRRGSEKDQKIFKELDIIVNYSIALFYRSLLEI